MARLAALSFSIAAAFLALSATSAISDESIQVGPRPAFLIDQLPEGELRSTLAACESAPLTRTLFSIGHRGAALFFPEHTRESYRAAAKMGAGIVECDVAFTKDHELVCRHAHNDLHTTTNILASNLASTCKTPFAAAAGDQTAKAECRTTDITLAEFKSLTGKMDSANSKATTVPDYMAGTANWRTDLYAASSATLITHAESIELIKSLGVKFTPELKTPSADMLSDDFTQADFAQKMIDEYKTAGIPASDVWAQSFLLDDVLYWIKNEPEFGKQAVYLDDRYDTFAGFDPLKPETFKPSMAELKAEGVNYIAPPIWVLLTTENGKIVPSPYATEATAAGLNIITWTLERSGPLNIGGGGWYHQSITDAVTSDAQVYEVLDVLAQQVGVKGVFSDWPATVSYYASCMGLN